MKQNHYLGKTFGPMGSSAGIVLFFFGLIAAANSLWAILLILFGAFLGFTSERTIIHFELKKLNYSTHLFGFIRTGSWMDVEPSMKLRIRKSKKNWRCLSWGNRTFEFEQENMRIVLCDSHGNQILPIKDAVSLDQAELEIKKLSGLLDIGSF